MGLNDVVATTGPGPGGTKKTSIRSYRFFSSSAIAAGGLYVSPGNGPISFDDADGTVGFTANSVELINDGAADIFFSFDGTNDHGKVKPGLTSQQHYRRETRIWVRGTAGGAFRLSAW